MLDRTQPGLPIKQGRGATMTHDYKRNGTTTLFAALNTANGEVFGLCQKKHRHQERLKLLRMIDKDDTRKQRNDLRQLLDPQTCPSPTLTGIPQTLPCSLPADICQLAQYDRTLLPRPDAKPTQTRRFPRPQTAHHRHRKLHRHPQQEPQTLPLDCQSNRHP
jgi:hypothetical protein